MTEVTCHQVQDQAGAGGLICLRSTDARVQRLQSTAAAAAAAAEGGDDDDEVDDVIDTQRHHDPSTTQLHSLEKRTKQHLCCK